MKKNAYTFTINHMSRLFDCIQIWMLHGSYISVCDPIQQKVKFIICSDN